MPITIRKRISLDFLGEEYKDAYFTLTTIPISEYEKLQTEVQKFEKDSKGSVDYMLNLLKSHFVKGEFPNEEGKMEPVTKEDLDTLDPVTLINVFKIFTSGGLDPKDEESLTSS